MIGLNLQISSFLVVVSAFFLAYYLLVHANYLALHIFALSELHESARERAYSPAYQPFSSPFLPGVAIIVPAYNEAPTIVESVRSLLAVKYADKELIVINDGSTDDTFDRLDKVYDLQLVSTNSPLEIPSEQIHGIYQSASVEELLVVDKENGGKSDALNAGIWITEKLLYCAIDADSVIDRDGLLQVIKPFLEDPDRTIATGGTIWAANGCEIEDGVVQSFKLPTNLLAKIQIVEYLRSFYAGRLGLSRLNSLIIISGAFGVFRTDIVREIGGYRQNSITEDLDLVLRIHRFAAETDREYRVTFVAEPIVLTEVPETLQTLSRQRRRWYRGLLDSVVVHRGIIGNRSYGRIGMYVFPAFVFVEVLGPLIESIGYLIVAIAFGVGALDFKFFLMYFVVTTGVGVLLSWFSVFTIVGGLNRYKDPKQIVVLLGIGIIENIGYRQWKAIVSWRGLFEYLRGNQSWGLMERSGFQRAKSETDK